MKKIESFLNSKKGKIVAWLLIVLVALLAVALVFGITYLHRERNKLVNGSLENSETKLTEIKYQKLSEEFYEINQTEKTISFHDDGIARVVLSDNANGPTEQDEWHDVTKEKVVEISDEEARKKYVYYQAGGSTYLINTKEEFLIFRDKVNGYKTFAGETVILMCDVDLADQGCWVHIGTLTQPFKGTFDGNGHIISNLNIDTTYDNIQEDYAGLFGYVDGGTIKNVTIQGGSLASGRYMGGIVGRLKNGTVDNCVNDGCTLTRKSKWGWRNCWNSNRDRKYLYKKLY